LLVELRDRGLREQVRVVDDVAAARREGGRERRPDGDGECCDGSERCLGFHAVVILRCLSTPARPGSCEGGSGGQRTATSATPTEVSTKIARTIQTNVRVRMMPIRGGRRVGG